jgi:hypothetical protein
MSGVERAQAEPARPAEEGFTRLKGLQHWPLTKRFHLRIFSNIYYRKHQYRFCVRLYTLLRSSPEFLGGPTGPSLFLFPAIVIAWAFSLYQ